MSLYHATSDLITASINAWAADIQLTAAQIDKLLWVLAMDSDLLDDVNKAAREIASEIQAGRFPV